MPGTTRRVAELLTNPRELLAARLRQMLWVELQLAGHVLRDLVEHAHTVDLKHGLERHLLATDGHVRTLREVLRDLEVPAEPEESPALEGLVKEHAQLVERVAEEGHVLSDLLHAQAAAATEHLEMAAYESLASVAEALGEEAVGIRLRELLEQEEFALEQLERATAKLLAEKLESERL
jgi:ferritin-like metal-binding protein YciE